MSTEPNITPAGSTNEPDGGLGDGALMSNDRTLATDARLIRRAALQRWPVSSALKAKLAQKIDAALEAEPDGRIVASLGKVLTAMEAQNQADDHLQDKNDRLDTGKLTENAGLTFVITPVEPPNESQT